MPTDNTPARTATRDGWIACPGCGNPRLKLVHPGEYAPLVYVYCRRCKRDIRLTLTPEGCTAAEVKP